MGTSQDIDMNSRYVGSNLFQTNRFWWLSICSITPGKLRAIKLHIQLQIGSRFSMQAVIGHDCKVPGHTTVIIIAYLQRLFCRISRSALGGAIERDSWATNLQ